MDSSMLHHCSKAKRRKIEGHAGFNETEWEMKPVLADELIQTPKLELVVACELDNKKIISNFVKEISRKFQCEKLKHVKRVKIQDGQILVWICPTDSLTESVSNINDLDFIKLLNDHGLEPEGVGQFHLCQVPSNPALTRAQYEEGAKYWPIVFHENQDLKKKLNTSLFSSSELHVLGQHMRKAISLAEYGITQGGMPVAAMVVDPGTQEVMAAAYDMRHQNPLMHAAMVAIDLVAQGQGGSVWKLGNQDKLSYVDVSDQIVTVGDKSGPYLCSGYDLLITREPCVMCSMALIHARINRVFYGCPTRDGAMGSKLKLHTLNGLNHHFDVYFGVEQPSCEALFS